LLSSLAAPSQINFFVRQGNLPLIPYPYFKSQKKGFGGKIEKQKSHFRGLHANKQILF